MKEYLILFPKKLIDEFPNLAKIFMGGQSLDFSLKEKGYPLIHF